VSLIYSFANPVFPSARLADFDPAALNDPSRLSSDSALAFQNRGGSLLAVPLSVHPLPESGVLGLTALTGLGAVLRARRD